MIMLPMVLILIASLYFHQWKKQVRSTWENSYSEFSSNKKCYGESIFGNKLAVREQVADEHDPELNGEYDNDYFRKLN